MNSVEMLTTDPKMTENGVILEREGHHYIVTALNNHKVAINLQTGNHRPLDGDFRVCTPNSVLKLTVNKV